MQKRKERGARAHSSISSTRKRDQKPVKSENESKGVREREHESGRESSGERWGALWQWQAGVRVRAGPSENGCLYTA